MYEGPYVPIGDRRSPPKSSVPSPAAASDLTPLEERP